MKKILIGLVRFYQKIPGNWRGSCKFQPTCSNYMITAIEEHGSLKGVYLGTLRIIRCNPFSKPKFDPVPERKIKK